MYDVFVSILGSAIVVVCAWLTRTYWLYGFFYTDIVKVYRTKKSALKAINKDVLSSEKIRILSIRGKSIVDDYNSIWIDSARSKNIEIKIAAIENRPAIIERSLATNKSEEEYEAQLTYTHKTLKARKNGRPNLSVLKHMYNPSFRIILFDDCMYISFYPSTGSVNQTEVLKYSSKSTAYTAFEHYYDNIEAKGAFISNE